MKKFFFIAFIFLFISELLFSQVSINTNGNPPHPSAGLDINFTNKGFLLPRMTFEQRNAIQNPAEGLIIYCTNCNADATGDLSIYQGGLWRLFNLNCYSPNTPASGTHVASVTQIIWNWTSVPIAIGYKWNTVNDYATATDIGLVTSLTETNLTCWTNYTRYLWAYNTCGQSAELVLTQSTLQIPLSEAPAAGDHAANATMIGWTWYYVSGATGYKWGTTSDYNTAQDMGNSILRIETGLTCNTNYTRYVWAYDGCGHSTATTLSQSTGHDYPAAPTAGTHTPSPAQIIWSWNSVAGATGYKWSTANDYATAINVGNTTTRTETSLTCNTPYTRYVWAYNNCDNSPVTTLTQSTSLDPPAAPSAATHVPSPTQIVWNWNSVPAATGYKWNTTNNYNTATEMGLSTSKTETSLTCNSPYTRYVWAYNSCGVSTASSLTQSTSLDPPASPLTATHVPSPTQIIWNWNTVAGATGYKWNTSNNYATASDMGTATTKTETSLICNTAYIRYIWAYNSCGVSVSTALGQSTSLDPPASPVTATHTPSPTQIIWNWNTVASATGYKWNTSNDYASATDLGNSTSRTEIGLICNSPYTRFVWAYSNCGVSNVTTLNQSTSLDPPASPVTATHVPSPTQIVWNWNTVSGATGYKWGITNVYANAVDMGSLTTRTETSLTCNTGYTRYVWSYNNCGVSTPTSLTQATSLDPPSAPIAGTHVPTPVQITWNWSTVSGATGYKWNTTNSYATATDMGAATTKTETALTCNTAYTRYVWAYSNCGVSSASPLNQSTSLNPPASPVAATHVPSPTQIIWNWNTVSGATGYKWNTVNDYATATDMGTATTKTETALTCNSPYIRYVWAYSNCGVSAVTNLSQSTSLNPPSAPVTATHVPSPTQIVWNWNTSAGATGYKWNTLNDYASALDMGSLTTHTETSLTCNTGYSRYIWAYSNCGVSGVTTLTQTSSLDPPAAPVAGTHVPSPTQIVWNWNTSPGATGYKWNTVNNYATATDLGANTTYSQTALICNTPYTLYVWAYSNCGVSSTKTLTQSTSLDPPASPVAGTQIATPSQITWNWNTVPAAAGYKWNTANDYATATDMGTATTRIESGLTCDVSYTRYVWSYNNCGVSASTALIKATPHDPPDSPLAAVHVPAPTQVVWKWHKVTGATGYKWSASDNYANATEMNTDTSRTESALTCNTSYTRYVWSYNNCDPSVSTALTQVTSLDPPVSPVAATHVPSLTQIVWNWNAVPGATGFKWNTTNDYGTATDLGNVTTKTETGLSCNSSYTRYFWAYSNCGVSSVATFSQSTSVDPPAAPATGNHVAASGQIIWNWNTVSGATGYKWNSTNDYNTAIDMGTSLSHTQSGLACNTAFTSYVWTYTNCGVSTSTVLSKSTTFDAPGAPVAASHVPGSSQIIWNWNAVSGATGYKWNTTTSYGTAIDLGSSLSRTETGLNCSTPYTRYVWAYNGCDVSDSTILTQTTLTNSPSAPAAGTHVASYTQIIWNWNTVADAIGYKWNTANDYATATDMGNVTSKTESSLTCGTGYTRYVWAYNGCGQSTSVTLTKSTLACWTCGNGLVINHIAGSVAPVSKSVTYGTVTGVPGETTKCWITSNLGADHQATAATDATEASAGWYWQFNRMQGYKHDGTSRTPNTTWIPEINEYSNWTAANDPCTIELGSIWRIPTITEWTNIDAAGIWVNYTGPWNSVLKMHLAGRIDYFFGTLADRGSKGYCWSITQTGLTTTAQGFFYSSSASQAANMYKSYGQPLRCVHD
jgi:hypothetical protein